MSHKVPQKQNQKLDTQWTRKRYNEHQRNTCDTKPHWVIDEKMFLWLAVVRNRDCIREIFVSKYYTLLAISNMSFVKSVISILQLYDMIVYSKYAANSELLIM